MSFRDRDAPESSRGHHGPSFDQAHRCDFPIRVVAVEPSNDAVPSVFRVISGRQFDSSTTGAAFICPVRIPGNEVFLELRSSNRSLHFEAATIVHESQTQDGRWRYEARFVEPECKVDRYDFD